ncbi:anti-phage defense-associated sirtuin Dsr1 [Rhizobium leguminosarum]|uniref:anti-phage defense-associated sirtuin Dsr1 n=1 Tax=Rhizobium leguminosarum TaxID=384 RepID=UPI00143F516F|nr:anti-phage defense-associated sirtuin Dsr1 [Rhizobium leguminosarum]NKL21117.1 hypothetical protein [Rhizobium leguminosarum bv. viciae]NKL56824.1 hypothetical protein [Rhizobium leguminosarum bv. viciae]
MQFVKDGPEVPESLLQAHEDGTVVFFCGAGISYPAGLPGFSGLVHRIYEGIGAAPNGIENKALEAGLYDTAIGLLEGRLAGGRQVVRRQAFEVLKPDQQLPGAVRTHEALLTLAESRSGQSRLVTTNFDPLFEEAMVRRKRRVPTFNAPLLPIPKGRWDGLVYLHGMFPEDPSESDLNRLVLASGDFGLAYLMERWAARFVSELLRNFTVCFVGYSINDPVMRYMMDALAADRLMGEAPGESFAFGSFGQEGETAAAEEWAAKNVTPILYRATDGHPLLHETLDNWAGMYRDGVSGKEAVVTRYAAVEPTIGTKQDDFVRRMIWALSDGSGLPAKHFADFNPLPPLSWLEPLAQHRFSHDDLVRYGIVPSEKKSGVTFGVLDRPSPYSHASRMSLVLRPDFANGAYDQVMFHLARWVARHAEDPKLLTWIAQRGGALHPRFRWSLVSELRQRPAKKGSAVSILWGLLLAGRVRSRGSTVDLYEWQERLSREGFTMGVRLTLREALTPYVELREPYRFDENENDDEREKDDEISAIVRSEIVLGTDHVHSALREVRQADDWRTISRDILHDVTALLRDAMDLRRELEGASDIHDYSYIHRPSVSDHEQNRDFNDWTVLIELVRDGWLALADDQPARALLEAHRWLDIKYPIFRRLAFFAATERPDIVPPKTALEWLLEDGSWWLWTTETQRETLLLIAALGKTLETADAETLQNAVLAGPPRRMFRSDIEEVDLNRTIDRETLLLLRKLLGSGVSMTQEAQARLAEIEGRYPNWKISEDDRHDFPFWMGDGEDWRQQVASPTSLAELEEWLTRNPGEADDESDDWAQRCEKDFETAATALVNLAGRGIWPGPRWRQALQSWSTDGLAPLSWLKVAGAAAAVPDQHLSELARGLSWWMGAVAKKPFQQPDLFVALIQRIFALYRDCAFEPGEDAQGRALNHPVGLATQALLQSWYQQGLEDAQGLREPFASLMGELCMTEFAGLHLGRIILARSVITLFRVDAPWTSERLLPYFDWAANPQYALSMWQAFLQSPRLFWPLLERLKSEFIETARHIGELGGTYERQYVTFLAFAAIQTDKSYTEGDFQQAFDELPSSAFEAVAEALLQGVSGAGDRRTEYFENRVLPFMKRHWRKSADVKTTKTSERIARFCVATGSAFPKAVQTLKDWLQRLEEPSFVVHVLKEADLCFGHPLDALVFLDAIIADDARWLRAELKVCLVEIARGAPASAQDHRFQRLVVILRKNGIPWP